MNDDLSSSNFILNNEVSVLDILSALGARESAILGHQDGRLVVLHKDIIRDFISLCLNKVKPHMMCLSASSIPKSSASVELPVLSLWRHLPDIAAPSPRDITIPV